VQRVQNAATRLIFELELSEHSTPSLIQLHTPTSRLLTVHAVSCIRFSHRVSGVYMSMPADRALASGQRQRSRWTNQSPTPRLRAKFGDERGRCLAHSHGMN